MKSARCKVAVLVTALAVVSVIPTSAQGPKKTAAVTLPAAGTFAAGGEFAGTVTINRFERRGNNEIVAIGVVTGVLSRGGQTLGSAVVAQVTWPVAVRVGGQVLASGAVREPGAPRPIAWRDDTPASFRLVAAQEVCQVVDIVLGGVTIDVLGTVIALSPITLNLSGIVGTPLGDLVCEVSELIGNVAALVGVLNAILNLLTGLLGGLLGGLGGLGGALP